MFKKKILSVIICFSLMGSIMACEKKGTDIPHHNPTFNIDEDVMWKGTVTFVRIIHNMLQIEKKIKHIYKRQRIYTKWRRYPLLFLWKNHCAQQNGV